MKNSVLKFWFEECTPEQWFKKDSDFDQLIKDRFEDLYWQVVMGEHEAWRDSPEGRLAEVIVLDQFSRNIFRNQARAFQNDPMALALAQEAVRCGDDLKLDEKQRHFLYMPYMHSESKLVHVTALKLFEALGNENALKFELSHKNIIDKFGRYPHRNAILGRESTHEELEFLKEHGGF